MIKILKLGNAIYENIEPKTIDENGNEIWNVPNDFQKLKQAFVDTIKWQAYTKLKETDWIIIKCLELGLNPADEYPNEIQTRRAIRTWVNEREVEINNASSIDDLLKIDLRLPQLISLHQKSVLSNWKWQLLRY